MQIKFIIKHHVFTPHRCRDFLELTSIVRLCTGYNFSPKTDNSTCFFPIFVKLILLVAFSPQNQIRQMNNSSTKRQNSRERIKSRQSRRRCVSANQRLCTCLTVVNCSFPFCRSGLMAGIHLSGFWVTGRQSMSRILKALNIWVRMYKERNSSPRRIDALSAGRSQSPSPLEFAGCETCCSRWVRVGGRDLSAVTHHARTGACPLAASGQLAASPPWLSPGEPADGEKRGSSPSASPDTGERPSVSSGSQTCKGARPRPAKEPRGWAGPRSAS